MYSKHFCTLIEFNKESLQLLLINKYFVKNFILLNKYNLTF